MQKQKDGRAIAKSNEIRILRALQRFGWLRTRDLASLCWTRWPAKPVGTLKLDPVLASASSIRMAQRTLKRLRKNNQVLSFQAPDGSLIYSLAESGVKILANIGIKSKSGKDLTRRFSSAFFRHRCIANEVAISAITQGYRVSSEREIAQGNWLAGEKGLFGKRPDVVIRNDKKIILIEVERSRKNSKDYQFLIEWIKKLSTQNIITNNKENSEKIEVQKLIFICTQAFRSKLQKDMAPQLSKLPKLNEFIGYSTELYNFNDILFS